MLIQYEAVIRVSPKKVVYFQQRAVYLNPTYSIFALPILSMYIYACNFHISTYIQKPQKPWYIIVQCTHYLRTVNPPKIQNQSLTVI
jgi:hypothetical protein